MIILTPTAVEYFYSASIEIWKIPMDKSYQDSHATDKCYLITQLFYHRLFFLGTHSYISSQEWYTMLLVFRRKNKINKKHNIPTFVSA